MGRRTRTVHRVDRLLAQFRLDPSDRTLTDIRFSGEDLSKPLRHTVDTAVWLLEGRNHLSGGSVTEIVEHVRDTLTNWQDRSWRQRWKWLIGPSLGNDGPSQARAELGPLAAHVSRLRAIQDIEFGLFSLVAGSSYECPNCGHRCIENDSFHFCDTTAVPADSEPAVEPELTATVSAWAGEQTCVCGRQGLEFVWGLKAWPRSQHGPGEGKFTASRCAPLVCCPSCGLELTEEFHL